MIHHNLLFIAIVLSLASHTPRLLGLALANVIEKNKSIQEVFNPVPAFIMLIILVPFMFKASILELFAAILVYFLSTKYSSIIGIIGGTIIVALLRFWLSEYDFPLWETYFSTPAGNVGH